MAISSQDNKQRLLRVCIIVQKMPRTRQQLDSQHVRTEQEEAVLALR
jgi:hypothetical protein